MTELKRALFCSFGLTKTFFIPSVAHVGKLREVREVREKLRDKCPTSYGKRLLSLNFPNDRRK